MKTILHEVQFFGPTSYYSHYIGAETLLLEKHENYQKRSFRNRYHILTANGPTSLSIPLVKGKNNQQAITDVKISYDENWPEVHLQTIRSAYGKSAYFEYYFPELHSILSKRPAFLFDLNINSLQWTLKKLKLDTSVLFTESFCKNIEEEALITDLRNTKLTNQPNTIKYPQVWADKFDFTAHLSILDLLFCTGPEASFTLSKMSANFIT